MRYQIGVGLQFVVLVFLPMLVIWQLQFGFALGYMPACLVAGMILFGIGTRLRES